MTLYLRGDFYCCPNPLSYDPYTKCYYDCAYCFIKYAETTYLKRRAQNSLTPTSYPLGSTIKKGLDSSEPSIPLLNCIHFNIPIIIGRKCEPLGSPEQQYHETRKVIRILNQYGYPFAIETQNIIPPEYFSLFHENSVAKITLIPSSHLYSLLMPNLPSYSERLQNIKELINSGINCMVTCEPIISSLNDDSEIILTFANDLLDAGVKRLNFGELKWNNLPFIFERFQKLNISFREIVRAKLKWNEKSKEIYSLLTEKGLEVASPDWINIGLKSPFLSCCGFDGILNYHKFTFQNALHILKTKGKVSFEDLKKYNIFNQEYERKFKEVWFNPKKYFSLGDVNGVVAGEREGEWIRLDN